MAINELRRGGGQQSQLSKYQRVTTCNPTRRRNSLRLNDLRYFLPEKIVLTVLAHRGDVELLETQRVLEGGEQNRVVADGATLGGDCLTAVDASDGGDGGLQFRSLDGGLWCPVHFVFTLVAC